MYEKLCIPIQRTLTATGKQRKEKQAKKYPKNNFHFNDRWFVHRILYECIDGLSWLAKKIPLQHNNTK